MPIESRSYSIPGTTLSRSWNDGSNRYPGVTSSFSQSSEFGDLVRNSTTTPGYRWKSSIGRLPENNFGFSETRNGKRCGFTQTCTIAINGSRSWSRTEGVIGSFVGTPPTFLSMASFMESEVRANLMDKIHDSDVDIGTFVGEYRETAEMFHTFSVALVSAVKAARRGNPAGVAKALGIPRGTRDFANIWLMVLYGIRPFVSDITGACKALDRGLHKEGFVTVHSRKQYEDHLVTTSGVVDSSSGLTQTTWTYKVEVSGRVKYTVTDSNVATFSSLGLSNPFALGWELTRLSFVFDWAIGVGSWLSQLDATFGKQFSGGSITTFVKTRGLQEIYQNQKTSTVERLSEQQAIYEKTSCNRVAITSWPINWLPAIKDPTSLSHVITSLALLKQRY